MNSFMLHANDVIVDAHTRNYVAPIIFGISYLGCKVQYHTKLYKYIPFT